MREHFIVEVGDLRVVGPHTGQTVEVAAGVELRVLGITGEGLVDGSRMLVSSKPCDDEGGAQPVAGIPGVDGYTGRSDESTGSGAEFVWGHFDAKVFALGGSYTMCWCPPTDEENGCTTGNHFRSTVR